MHKKLHNRPSGTKGYRFYQIKLVYEAVQITSLWKTLANKSYLVLKLKIQFIN